MTNTCTNGHIGDLFVLPSGDRDEPFAVRVVAGLNKSPEDCVRDGYVGGCIVARRSLRFLPNETLELPIVLEVICRDVPCEATQTCRRGKCVSASIDDPSQCLNPEGCDVMGAGADSGGASGSGGTSAGAGAGAGGVGAGGTGASVGGSMPGEGGATVTASAGSGSGGGGGGGGAGAGAGAGASGGGGGGSGGGAGAGGSGSGGGGGGTNGGQPSGGMAGAPVVETCGPVNCSAPSTCCNADLGTCSLPGGACPF